MDATATPTSPPLPLTYENLRALTMASAGPSTPPKGGSTKSGSMKSNATSRVPVKIRRHLRHFNIFVDELRLPQADPSIRDLEARCVRPSRGSPGLSENEHDEIEGLFRTYETLQRQISPMH